MEKVAVASREWNSLSGAERETISAHQQGLPVSLGPLARALGVPVLASTLSPGISGELRPGQGGGFVIRVNRHDPPVRQRFTVAHEIAHFLLHRDHIGQGIEDDVLYRSSLSDQREAEANRLAADILMPYDVVHRAYRQALRTEVDPVVAVAQKFGVSEQAMRIRLGL